MVRFWSPSPSEPFPEYVLGYTPFKPFNQMLKLGLNIEKVVFLSCFVEGKFKSLVKCWLEAVRRIYRLIHQRGAVGTFSWGGGTSYNTGIRRMKERWTNYWLLNIWYPSFIKIYYLNNFLMSKKSTLLTL